MAGAGWGVTVLGFDEVFDALESLGMRFGGDTVYVVGPTVEYGIYNELGTSKMEARPYMRPAAERVEASPRAMLEQYAQSGIRTEEDVIRTLAIAVQNEAKKIADRKGVRESGDLIASITYEKVQ